MSRGIKPEQPSQDGIRRLGKALAGALDCLVNLEIDHHGPRLRGIEQRQNIAIACQLPPDKTEMQLLVLI